MDRTYGHFLWDIEKENINVIKHGVDFQTAARAFLDPNLRIFIDAKHDDHETRLFCFGKVNERILTVRFVYREEKIRIFGAGYWRMGRSYYEKEKEI